MLSKLQGDIKADQSLEFILRLVTSPKDIFESGSPIVMEFLRGFEIEYKMNVWKKLSDFCMKLMESGELPEQVLPIIGGISPALLLKVNGHLNIEVDDYMKQKITENPLTEPIMLDAPTLVQSASNVHSDDESELNDHIEENLPPPLQPIIKFFMKHLGDEVYFAGGNSFVCGKSRLSTKGLSHIVTTMAKFK